MGDIVLAKSTRDGKQIALDEHTRAVLNASEVLFGTEGALTHLGRAWLRFFGIDQANAPGFIRNTRAACALHDLGKANDGFQAAVTRGAEQLVRHEHLSALLMWQKPMQGWLLDSSGIDPQIVLAAVASHHLNVSNETLGHRLIEGDRRISFCLHAPSVHECFRLAAQVVNGQPPDLSACPDHWDRAVLTHLREDFKGKARTFRHALTENGTDHRLLVATKAAVVVADAAGSGLLRENIPLEQWLQQCFGGELLSGAWVEERVIRPRVGEIEQRQGAPFAWQDFQDAAAALGPRALLISACGSGKTLAAWRWIKAQLERRPAARVIFLYPTRATATEGFRDYVSWAGGEFAALQHGTSEYDLQGMFDNPGDPRRGGDYHVQERLFALGYWPRRVFSATVDAFLAFMRNQYASLCMLPVLCDSVVVIDEIHSFDNRMFTALERFLNFFDIPVLCMTATLPEDRRNTLQHHCNMEVFPADPGAFVHLKKRSDYPRYCLRLPQDDAHAEATAFAALSHLPQHRHKVLWVLNTVSRCQDILRRLAARLPRQALLGYHSRFRLKDRKQRHEDAIRRFRSGPLWLITTQVCEMSLDLDADILITESAPVPSLIQRMGRCCREPEPSPGRVGLVIAYPPGGPHPDAPYESDEMREGQAFLDAMAARTQPLSQADLARFLEEMDIASPFAREGYAGFLDSGMYAMSHGDPFREGDEYTVTCVLDTDIPDYVQLRRAGDPAAVGVELPVPRRFAQPDERLGRLIQRAPASHYHPDFGFCNQEVLHG